MWHEFHARHFGDEQRAWFTSYSNTSPGMDQAQRQPQALSEGRSTSREQLEDRWTDLEPGETEIEWQERHGLEYLTPGAARVFDISRRFREQRNREEQEELESNNNVSRSTVSPCPSDAMSDKHRDTINNANIDTTSISTSNIDSLAMLRARALAAKRTR